MFCWDIFDETIVRMAIGHIRSKGYVTRSTFLDVPGNDLENED